MGVIRAVLSVIGVGLLLAGCFQPLHGSTFGGGSTRAKLSSVDVAPIPELTGHYLEEELRFAFNGGNPAGPSLYRIRVTLVENVAAAAVNSSSGRAEAASLQVKATYHLEDMMGRKVFEGTAVASAAIDRLSQRFAALRANRDARIRVAKALSDIIQTRIGVYLVTKA